MKKIGQCWPNLRVVCIGGVNVNTKGLVSLGKMMLIVSDLYELLCGFKLVFDETLWVIFPCEVKIL